METLGQKLQSAREARDISFDQASKDTKISIRHLQALENEDFSSFPSEAYITGFLRNYGAYLEIDTEELFSLYRALRIQEQPTPVEQLLHQPSPAPKVVLGILLGILAVGLIGGLIYYVINRPQKEKIEPPPPKARTPVEHSMSGDTFDRRFFIGDSILIALGEDEQFRLELEDVGEAVTITTPDGTVIIDSSQHADVTIDDSGTVVRVSAVDYEKNRADMGVQLRFELTGVPAVSSGWESSTSTIAANIPSRAITTVIFTSANPHPFTLQSVFQGNCMFRWEILMERDRRERGQQYFQRSQEFNITANNGIRVWISNAQAARFSVMGAGRSVSFELGNPGEVVVSDIRWVRDDDNRFRLIVARLET